MLKKFVLLSILLAAAFLALSWFRVGPPPEITVEAALPAIGPKTPITITAAEPSRGLSSLTAELVQSQDEVAQSWHLAEAAFEPRPFWAFWGKRTDSHRLELEVGRESLSGLREGEATLRITAGRATTWLRKPEPMVSETVFPVRLTPPRLELKSTANNVAQGGSAMVLYKVGDSAVRDGVAAGERWFPGFPVPGGDPGQRFALFAASYDLQDPGQIFLVAEDEVGNRLQLRFLDGYKPLPLAHDTIRLSDAFLARVVPAILERTPEISATGDLLQDYLTINGDLRRANREELRKLAQSSEAAFLWERPFRQLPRSQVMAGFAERRSYLYDGREVDQQDHLGFDLASVRQAPVPASNDGKVVLARYFGIYGNAVIVDHGYGLASLYAHLTAIDVAVGDSVARGQSLGTTGATGLAGGDHLHFAILLQGLPVDPREWWDAGWIRTRIADPLRKGFSFRENDQ